MLLRTGYIIGRLREVRREVTQSYNGVAVHSAEEMRECYREPGIVSGYRKNYSVSQVVLSLFQSNNETVNFWTHFLPSLYFLWNFISLSSTMSVFSDPYLYPLACHLVTSCTYPLASCLAHAFSCISPKATYVCFFLDYAALSLYSWGTSVLYFAYTFPVSSFSGFYSASFLPVAAVNAVLATFFACGSRFVENQRLVKILRLGAYIVPFVWDSIPLVYRLITCDTETDSCERSMPYHLVQFASVFAASFFYASHIPERFAPGRFDFVGNSHNLLHLFGIIATHEQIRGAIVDLTYRKEFLQKINWVVHPAWVVVVTPVVLILNLIIIITSVSLLNKVEPFCNDSTLAFHGQQRVNDRERCSQISAEDDKQKQH